MECWRSQNFWKWLTSAKQVHRHVCPLADREQPSFEFGKIGHL